MQRLIRCLVAVTCLLMTAPAFAKHRTHFGSCDGIHRCICGSTQARHFGFPRIVNGHNLWQAAEWGRAFPRTSIHAGAVGVKPHHVYRVVQPLGNGRAIVADERGQYERNVSGDIFVDPNGNRSFASTKPVHEQTYSARSHRRHTRMAASQSFTPPDRFGAGI